MQARAGLLQRYVDALNEWGFLADVKADVNVGRLLGSGTVMAFTYKTALAQVLPVAESYAAYAAAIDPYWSATVNQKLKDIDRSPGSNSDSLIARLAVLSTLPAGFTLQDPRPATTLFSEFDAVAREVAANEFGLERVKLAVDADVGDSVRLSVIPQMRDEVARNYVLLEEKTPDDIPELLAAKEQLAGKRIPYLLGAFLALSLIDENWDVHYEIGAGIQLCLGKRLVQPFTLVEQLDTKVIPEADFANALSSTPGSSG